MIGHPLKVRELLEEIARGEILLPEFQRAYVWKPLQVVKLLDSLYQEFPTGQILLWDTAHVPTTKNLEGVEPTRRFSMVGRPKIVLDGQQRLTSLYKALSPQARETVEVLFNIETEEFKIARKRLLKDPKWVFVRDVVTQDRHDLEILQEIAAGGGPDINDPACREYLERLRRLRRIGDYAFPIEIFRSDDFEEVTELFVRANSGGTRLRQAELVLAQLSLRLPGQIVENFEDAIEQYEQMGFALDARFLTRAVVAVGTGQSRFKNLKDLWKRSPEELASIWQRTQDALTRAVQFVRTNARFHSSGWVPSLNALIPLVAFFDEHKGAKDLEVGLLRWFYVVSLRGRYSTSPESAMDADLKAARKPNGVIEMLTNAIDAAGSLEIDPEEFDSADWRNPLYPLTYALAVKNGAKDLFTGITLGGEPSGTKRGVITHAIFPKDLLKKAKVSREKRDEVSNLLFLAVEPGRQATTRPPSEYLPEIQKADAARLEAQCVPLDPALWELDRYADFIEARRALLAEGINDLIDSPV